ncbi:hypothetical protein [Paenarthrobacter sp. YJN-5]|uniref:hypothetical protein n=1 Tax=Paenarthrobacter sp. YJN-5 TaxID=2735316 RepID=UPI0018785A65|nr:hypothetical protein [Paenarthrobacter sp. YJN-5]QOT19634.1 hypothetical protein HMI59_23765 [Paenarthrobacter sp. YJN-5]
MYALKLSFVLRYQKDVPRSVVVPLEKLAGINLADENIADHLLASILGDDDLMRELFGNYMHQYREMVDHTDIYWKDLMRFQEEVILVLVEA